MSAGPVKVGIVGLGRWARAVRRKCAACSRSADQESLELLCFFPVADLNAAAR